MEHPAHDPGRRALLRGRTGRGALHARLPWLIAGRFLDGCTRCGACLDACPENIIAPSAGKFPSVDFTRGECTFCAACVDACPEPLFDRDRPAPWHFKARVSEGCLAMRHIMCQSCEDACPNRAIAFRPVVGRLPTPEIDLALCTGCGACVSVCPAQAVSIR